MKPHRQGIKPADPALEEGREKQALRPFVVPRVVGAALYALFGLVLVIPWLRRLRRRPGWNAVRVMLAVTGLGLGVWAWTAGPAWWAFAPAAALTAGGALLRRTPDPDAERKLQRRHRARYLINGGRFEGREVYLLIREEQLMVVPRSGPEAGEVERALAIPRITRILVDGDGYVPVYVSEAKDPPVQAERPLTGERSRLELIMDGGEWTFEYSGAFAKHLAETAAHGVHSVREGLSRRELPVVPR